MIERTKEVNRYNYINRKWKFFKEWLRDVTRCYYVKDLVIDESTGTFTFRKVYYMRGVKFESQTTMEGIWEEESLEDELMRIKVYVREQKPETDGTEQEGEV